MPLIRARDEVRRRIGNPFQGDGAGSRDEAGPRAEKERLVAEEKSLTARIAARLGELGVANEWQLLQLVEVWFPDRFLAEADLRGNMVRLANHHAPVPEERYVDADGRIDV